MYLQINDKYRIASDRNQWMIQTYQRKQNRQTKEPEMRWVSESYYTTLESAVNNLAQLTVRLSEATSLVEALGVLGKVTEELTQALSPDFTVEEREVEQGSVWRSMEKRGEV